ncbi:epoxide hydrolase 4-like [Bradysia coprophila]|uniref:epoxide hydrolase 4-like n=1 Tax=Bradysia coprophila TaxID=38358 RepID=UPI00187D7FFA|nr:epoxide hydrolase 4-like [Bradysia coprophila]
MINPLSRIWWSSFVILTLIVYTISTFELQPKPRNTAPAALFDPKYGTHKFATVNGIRLHYVEAGDRTKPLMVFVHGFPDFWYSWRYQILEFSKDYWTVAIDMRGYAWSERPTEEKDYVLPYLIGDLKALIKYLNRKKCVLVSHDWGALIASSFIASNRHMVHKYILMGSPPRKVFKQLIEETMDQRNKSSYVLEFLKRGVAESELQANDYAFLSPLFKNEDLAVYKYVFSQPGALTAGLNYYRANISLEKGKLDFVEIDGDNDDLDGKNGMYILGGKDPYISQLSLNATAKEYPKMRVTVIPNAGHFLQQDESEITNNLIREFLGPNRF